MEPDRTSNPHGTYVVIGGSCVTPPVRFLIGTIVVGILVLVICGLLLRRPVGTNPFDQPATSSSGQ